MPLHGRLQVGRQQLVRLLPTLPARLVQLLRQRLAAVRCNGLQPKPNRARNPADAS